MEDLEGLVKNFLEDNYHANINQIIKYLLQVGYFFDELSDINSKIEKILKKYKNQKLLKYDDLTGNYTIKKSIFTDYDRENKLRNYGCTLIASILSIKENDYLDYKNINSFMRKYSQFLGIYSSIILEQEKSILESSLDMRFISIRFSIRNKSIIIRCSMNPIIEKDEPIYNYIIEQRNYFTAEKRIYMPLNFGVYFFYEALTKYFENNRPDFTIKINSVTYEE